MAEITSSEFEGTYTMLTSEDSSGGAFGSEPNSLAADLFAMHEGMYLEHTIDLAVPRFKGNLLVRYRAPGDKDIADVVKNKTDDIGEAFDANIKLLIRACQGIYINKDTGPQQLTFDDRPVKFDSDLAEVLQFDGKSAKEVLIYLFGKGEDASMSIHRQAQDLIEWSENRQGQINEDFKGN